MSVYTENPYTNATDEVLGRLNSSLAQASTVLGQDFTVVWPGREPEHAIVEDHYWARVSLQTTRSDNVGFGGDKRRITTLGLVYVQLFCPRSADDGVDQGRDLVDLILKQSFRSRPAGANVVFSNTVVSDLSPEPAFYRFNIKSDFQYDEIA